MMPPAIPSVPGLSLEHAALLNELSAELLARLPRNLLRRRYYDYRNTLQDLGIAIPPRLRTVETLVGWPAKAVDALAARTVLDGFTSTQSDPESMGLDALWDENRMDVEAPQAHVSCAVSSVSFVSVTAGDVEAGEPEALILARSATSATGIWDARRRCLSSALMVLSVDKQGNADHMAMFVPNLVIIMRKEGSRWDLRQVTHELGVPVEPLAYRPELERPFGRSRISRAVISLTDSAVRTVLRSEVAAEFYSAPQRYALGVAEDAFVDKNGNPIPAWQAVMGRILSLTADEDGNVPQVGQFQQTSMQPHVEQLRGLASLFASETNLPLSSLGIVQDNPASAEAIFAAKEDLVIDAQSWARTMTPAWKRIARYALAILDDSPAAIEAAATIKPRWMNPATPSIVSAADAFAKQVSVMPWLAESTVGLEQMGYDQDQIARLQADKRRTQAAQGLAALVAGGGTTGAE